MKFLKLFNNADEYNAYINSADAVLPMVSSFDNNVKYVKGSHIGDVAYWDGFEIQVIELSKYKPELGKAVGVVVIPSGTLPDGKARIMSLEENFSDWSWSFADTYPVPVTGYEYVEVRNPQDYYRMGNYAFVPSDKFYDTGIDYWKDKVDDPKVKYHSNLYNEFSDDYYGAVWSPYMSNGLLSKRFSLNAGLGWNAFSDFSGKSNTEAYINASEDDETAFLAVRLAKNYKVEGIDNDSIDWYLPAIGELAVMFTRCNVINNTINALGGKQINGQTYWSTTWHVPGIPTMSVYTLSCNDGEIYWSGGEMGYSSRAFAMID